MFANAQRLATVTVASGGAGYQVNDILCIPTDSCKTFDSGRVQVASINPSGAILTLNILDFGGWSNPPATPFAVVGGSGTGATLALTFTLYWQNVAWVVPSTDKMNLFLNSAISDAANQPYDQAGDDTKTAALAIAVGKVLSAIRIGRQVPLSLTPGAVPPEAEETSYLLAIQIMVGSMPRLAQYVVSQPGSSKPPLALMIEGATAWLADVRGGKAVEYPSDPDPSFRTVVHEGAMEHETDLSTFDWFGGYNEQVGIL
jgi:hypothetical protein